MSRLLLLKDVGKQDGNLVGGKGLAISIMVRRGIRVPDALIISTEAYREYVTVTQLSNRILLELGRKPFADMRWEEVWDVSLRLRNAFLRTPIPLDLHAQMAGAIEDMFSGQAVAVRSSAPGEDSAKLSFAGLHDSYVNVRGVTSILDHVRLVWASLWSDRALLYRQELGLDVQESAMAVVIQQMVFGERSGVIFGSSPVDRSYAIIEAVHGLNQGLVDGSVEPDRWLLHRNTGHLITHTPAHREKAVTAATEGVRALELSLGQQQKPPLDELEIKEVYGLAMQLEDLFGAPQDVEWTFKEDLLYALQSRPVTISTGQAAEDERRWYLSLRRSLENLRKLGNEIQDRLLPAMERDAAGLAAVGLSGLSDNQLATEIERRATLHDKRVADYYHYCIPFAHGIRLFGQFYNDRVRPSDPFEFMNLLAGSRMVSIRRNELLEELASRVRQEPLLAESLRSGVIGAADSDFRKAFEAFMSEFGDLSWRKARFGEQSQSLAKFLLEMAERSTGESRHKGKDVKVLEEMFLARFQGEQRELAAEVLEIGRTSYRLRDDDNTYLGRIEGQLVAAVQEGKRRVEAARGISFRSLESREVVIALREPGYLPEEGASPEKKSDEGEFLLRARQLVGQPAGQGIALGKARVIEKPDDLFEFKAGEVLVCEAVDPNMTFVVPLSSAIVERRGGMLIHGAIIAREYGIPCVTGVPGVTELVRTGDQITVDGFLGIVILGEPALRSTRLAA